MLRRCEQPKAACRAWRLMVGTLALSALLAGCDDGDSPEDPVDPMVDASIDASTPDAEVESDGGLLPDADVPDPDTGIPSEACAQIAAGFSTLGSANPDLPDPEVSVTCEGDSFIVRSNQIPDFPYIETSPGSPRASELEFTIPVTPVDAETPGAVPLIGEIGVAVNGIPIFGPTEGAGGDVMALGSGFSECGGHNGPSGYHYHTFDVTGSDTCRFSEAEAAAAPVLYGYALDGYPIYSGNFQYTSSYVLTDESLFATDTWSAHSYVEGTGDLDVCNGRFDDEGNYAYYTTETFPYIIGCYRGEVADGGGGGGGDRPPRP